MAVTKIHPIKSTLKKALDYIENPAKTDEKMLVSSFACAYETADIEFELLLSQAMQKGNNLAHHLIQSFAPDETTPEQAHEIGRQLADEVLQGKYPYVLTTHIDKGHVHNHIIFCAVDMVNQRKYVSNRRSYAYIRRTSDRLCKEHGLSVVMPGQDRGKSYAEWDAHRKGTSWKAKLKAAIDAAIPQAKDFDDFLRLLQEPQKIIKILGLRDGCIYGSFQLRLPACTLAVCVPLGIALASVLAGHYHGQAVFLAKSVTGAPDVSIAPPVGNILALVHHVHCTKDNVVVDVPFVNVGGQHIRVFALQDFICKLPANLVGLLRRGFIRRKRLYQVVGQIVAFLHGL